MAIIRSDTLTLQVTSADQQQALANTLALYRRLVRDLMTVAYPGCCTGSVRGPQMPGSVGIKGIWGGVWLFLIKFLCSGRTSPHPHVFSVPGTARRDAIPAPACWPTSGRGPAPDTGCSTSAEWSVCCE